MKRSRLIIPLISAFFFVFTSCHREFYQNSGYTWGTTYRIVYSSDRNLGDSITSVLALVDSTLSVFHPGSEINRLNAGSDEIVSLHVRRVFGCARHVNALSGGAFDPTVGPLVDLWGFGPGKQHNNPSPEEISRALRAVGIDSCSIGQNGRMCRKSPDTRFNFSALAKGYGVDLVAGMLRRNGVEDYMVEIGGEIALAGHSPRGTAWRIQVDAPVRTDNPDSLHTCMEVLELGPEPIALATSGNYRNYRTVGDTVVGHTIDPRTGYPARAGARSVTVMARDCMTADALATAAMAMCPDSAEVMLSRHALRHILIR